MKRSLITSMTFVAAILAFLALGAGNASAQTVLEGGEVHTVSGGIIEDGVVVIGTDGRIDAVGEADAVSFPEGADVVDVSGKIVTPGLVETRSSLGLVEIWAAKGTRDVDPGGEDPIRAAFRASDAFNPNSTSIPINRVGGVTSLVANPRGGLVSGQSAWVDLGAPAGGRPVFGQIVGGPVAMHIEYGEAAASATGGSRGGAMEGLRELYDDVEFYRENREGYDANQARKLAASRLDLEALATTLDGTLPVFFRAHRASDIRAVLSLADDMGLDPVIVGGAEAWMVRDLLAERNVPVIVDPTANLPSRFESLGAREDNAALLADAGVTVVLSTFDSHNVRNLRQYAGNAVRAGLPHASALEAVTLSAATAAGRQADYGSLDPGKVANIVVWSGDPFELSTDVEKLYIQGRDVSLDHRQLELFERYRQLERRGPPAPRTPEDDVGAGDRAPEEAPRK
ncbi:MAG: amidohydrolase family protein [Myxococcota bacterium]